MTTKQERTRELVRLAQLGDQSAWTELYQQNWNKIYYLCGRFSQTDTEDLAQMTMVKCFQKLHLFEGKAQFSTWLHRVAVNTCLMARRKAKLDTVSLEDVDGNDILENMPSSRNEEAAAIARMDLGKVLPLLPDGYARVLMDRDWLGYETSETAENLGVSAGCIKSQLHRGRLRVRQMLTEGKRMEQEVCGSCKEAGFLDKLAHYKSYMDGQGRKVPAQCYYHHLGQEPPWVKSAGTVERAGTKWGQTLNNLAQLKEGQSAEVELPAGANVNGLRSILYGAKLTSYTRWSVKQLADGKALITRMGEFPTVNTARMKEDMPLVVSRSEPKRMVVVPIPEAGTQLMKKSEYISRFGNIHSKGMTQETTELWERLQQLSFEDVMLVPCLEGQDVFKLRSKLSNSVQRLVRINKPAYRCVLGANTSKRWVVIAKELTKTEQAMAAKVTG